MAFNNSYGGPSGPFIFIGQKEFNEAHSSTLDILKIRFMKVQFSNEGIVIIFLHKPQSAPFTLAALP